MSSHRFGGARPVLGLATSGLETELNGWSAYVERRSAETSDGRLVALKSWRWAAGMVTSLVEGWVLVHAIRGGPRAGVLAAFAFALTGCDGDASVAERIELVDAIAVSAGETELGRVHDLAAREDELDDGRHDDLARVMNDLEPPADVAEIVVPMDRASTSRGTGPDGEMLMQVARVMVVVPESGEPFCAAVGLGSDGTAAGTLANGEVDDACRDAQIPVQSQNAFEGNPLDLWDQDARWLDPRDPPPS